MAEWKRTGNGKAALLIDGARRVGKSYVAEEFAKNNYKSYLLIDFNEAGQEIKDLFEQNLRDLDHLFTFLSAVLQSKALRKRISDYF